MSLPQTMVGFKRACGPETMKVFNFVSTCHGNLCKAQFKDTALMDQLKAEKFDLALGENFDLCYYGVLRRIGVKNYITVFSTTQYENAAMALGIPSTPSFVPGIFNGMKPPFTYLQRTTNLIAHLFSWQFLHTSFGGPANSFLKTIYGKDFEAMVS
uniref:glucuronosyltransferase n=1 Tax=Acrobeloides nanus TaxID=290746 RepID=A0A914D3B1_9BILA